VGALGYHLDPFFWPILPPPVGTNEHLHSMYARQVFMKLMQIMGDFPAFIAVTSSKAPTTTPTPTSLLQELLALAMSCGPTMVDELFVMLVVQLSANPSKESALSGWETLAVVAGVRRPSHPSVLAVLETFLVRTATGAGSAHKEAAPFAALALSHLLRPQSALRHCPVSRAEVAAVTESRGLSCSVFLGEEHAVKYLASPPGEKPLRCDSITAPGGLAVTSSAGRSVRYVMDVVARQAELSSSEGFGFLAVVGDLRLSVPLKMLLGDLLFTLETLLPPSPLPGRCVLLLRRLYWPPVEWGTVAYSDLAVTFESAVQTRCAGGLAASVGQSLAACQLAHDLLMLGGGRRVTKLVPSLVAFGETSDGNLDDEVASERVTRKCLSRWTNGTADVKVLDGVAQSAKGIFQKCVDQASGARANELAMSELYAKTARKMQRMILAKLETSCPYHGTTFMALKELALDGARLHLGVRQEGLGLFTMDKEVMLKAFFPYAVVLDFHCTRSHISFTTGSLLEPTTLHVTPYLQPDFSKLPTYPNWSAPCPSVETLRYELDSQAKSGYADALLTATASKMRSTPAVRKQYLDQFNAVSKLVFNASAATSPCVVDRRTAVQMEFEELNQSLRPAERIDDTTIRNLVQQRGEQGASGKSSVPPALPLAASSLPTPTSSLPESSCAGSSPVPGPSHQPPQQFSVGEVRVEPQGSGSATVGRAVPDEASGSRRGVHDDLPDDSSPRTWRPMALPDFGVDVSETPPLAATVPSPAAPVLLPPPAHFEEE